MNLLSGDMNLPSGDMNLPNRGFGKLGGGVPPRRAGLADVRVREPRQDHQDRQVGAQHGVRDGADTRGSGRLDAVDGSPQRPQD